MRGFGLGFSDAVPAALLGTVSDAPRGSAMIAQAGSTPPAARAAIVTATRRMSSMRQIFAVPLASPAPL